MQPLQYLKLEIRVCTYHELATPLQLTIDPTILWVGTRVGLQVANKMDQGRVS